MAAINSLENENYEELSSDNKELLDRIRTLTRENRELKKQLAECDCVSEGEELMNHHCENESSGHKGMYRRRGMGHGQGKGCCSRHGNDEHGHGSNRGGSCNRGISDSKGNGRCCRSERNELTHCCSGQEHKEGRCCCHQ